MKKEILYALRPTVATEMTKRWNQPCLAMFDLLAKHHPYDLLNLIKENVLGVSDLTFAAEMAGVLLGSFN